MSKTTINAPSTFSLEMDDRTEEEKAKAKAKQTRQNQSKNKMLMDSKFQDDVVEPKVTVKVNLRFDTGIRGIVDHPSDGQNAERFDIVRLFEAAASGDVSRLQGLEQYLTRTRKHLTDSLLTSNGKTALLKALLNLKNGENDTIEFLLNIAEKMGDLTTFVNAAYTDSNYKGQTALHVAIERRSTKFVEMLVRKGANVHAKACGKFFQPSHGFCFYFGELPLSLAACTNQPEIVDFLMESPHQPVDVSEKDSHGNTVLHALVSVADNSPENTEFVIAMYDHILVKSAQLHPKIKLEQIRNHQGLTSFKLAAKMGKCGLFKHIMQREFKDHRHLSRKITEWAYGPVCSSLYDLSSLDTYERNSALEIIVYGSEIPNRTEMLQVEPFNKLLEEKWNKFAKHMFLFRFIVYLFYLSIFTVVAYYHEQEEELTKNLNLLIGTIITIIGAFYLLLRGLIDVFRKHSKFQSLLIDGYSDQLFILQALLFMLSAALYCFKRDEYLAILVLCLALSWVNLLYFSRGSKYMGIYNVMIQKMVLGEVSRFLVVYMVFLIGFSAAVVTLLVETVPKKKSLTDLIGNTENKKTFVIAMLELFKFTIGMGDMEFTDQYKYQHVFYVLLIVYIVMTFILLLNMLIALMSQSVERMCLESTDIWRLQRAITILDMEWTLPKCIKKRLRSGEEKDLGEGSEPDRRWCLSVEEINWNKWKSNVSIINEDPGNFMNKTLTDTSQRVADSDAGRRGFLSSFSRRWTQRRPHSTESTEMRALAQIV